MERDEYMKRLLCKMALNIMLKEKDIACRTCEDKVSSYGKCKKGYDNFYYRKSKDNGCEKCKKS